MSQDREMLAELLSGLKQQRSGLAVKIRLGNAEAKDQWNRIQTKLDKLSKNS